MHDARALGLATGHEDRSAGRLRRRDRVSAWSWSAFKLVEGADDPPQCSSGVYGPSAGGRSGRAMTSRFRTSSVLFGVAVVLSACGGGGGGGATLRALDARSEKARWTEPVGADSVVAVAAVAGTVVVEEGRCDAEAISVVGLDSATRRSAGS